MSVLYLATLLICAACVVAVDLRFRLFLGKSPRAALAVLVIGAAFFIAWDLVGIATGIFARGETPYMTGLLLAPELPVEELVFLLFFCEVTMVTFCGAERIVAERRRKRS
ncbi:lycopene cyclase domain-containing protein [Microbacterium amylolyticum]|uniref:Lycopene cyclase domain-containing protein n=1 Tax=Microbacterium amylolyticum TaxID=936337 RepID=A0ABS4ZHB1_9MICO|nr:lycopene cyclase domain-containing protein [Microbacterium amylolyticum]MBP2435871.1 lycopene cyclase domain-containing protein [Microbacterium amylolyticum]